MSTSNDLTLPAILGGKPIRPEGPPAWPPAWEEVSRAVKQSLDDGGWGLYHGPNTRLLTERLSSYHDVEFVELCCSGTFAIELALRALQIGPGDEVILAAYDFIGNFNDVVAVGLVRALVCHGRHRLSHRGTPRAPGGPPGPRRVFRSSTPSAAVTHRNTSMTIGRKRSRSGPTSSLMRATME